MFPEIITTDQWLALLPLQPLCQLSLCCFQFPFPYSSPLSLQHRDQQLEGIDIFETYVLCPMTYALVFQWNTFCLMNNLENSLGPKSKQTDVTSALCHATFGFLEKVYVEMPLEFMHHALNGKVKFFYQENSLKFVSKSLCLLEISQWKTCLLWPTICSFWWLVKMMLHSAIFMIWSSRQEM